MESTSGSTQNPSTVACTIATATTTITTAATPGSAASNNSSGPALLVATGGSSGSSGSVGVSVSANPSANVAAALTPAKPLLQLDTKQEEANNLSLASGISEGQRSLSGAPSASSSPILSPPGKIFGRNANGTMIATSRPSNEAEVQLYRVLQRASLLAYYDTLLEMGGDDVQQLYEAGEEEFLEIMALVGMASKPLHVRRLQKALHEWANNPALFQGPIIPGMAGFCDTPTKTITIYNPEPRAKCSSLAHAFNPTPLMNTAQTSSAPPASPLVLPQLPPTPSAIMPGVLQHAPLPLPATAVPGAVAAVAAPLHQPAGATSHQVTSSSPQLTPVLTEMQVARITLGAEKIARQLPQREPRAQTSKKRTSRELEQVIAMSENDPRRMDEIRKYSAIYGRFDCKRRPEKPLTLHEVCVNEAAAQLCRLVPALLTRRDELFPLARQIVKDAGFGHSASIARYGGLIPQLQSQQTQRSSVVVVDCESSDSSVTPKRQRLSSTDTATTPDFNRENMDDSRYNLFAMYQKFAKPPFDLSDIAKFSLGKSDYDDNDNDNESRYSFSNSSSPSMTQHNGSENERDFSDGAAPQHPEVGLKSPTLHKPLTTGLATSSTISSQIQAHLDASPAPGESVLSTSSIGGVQVISAAGGHIIAVANPALALSPTLNDTLSVKREVDSPEIL